MSKPTFGVVVFPGSNCDQDCLYVIEKVIGCPVKPIWHKDSSLDDVEALILPGGFSYGDYLRAGAIARFSPVMSSVIDFAKKGKLVIGICNGFQVLLECGLLPGAMIRNDSLYFECRMTNLKVESLDSPFTSLYQKDQVIQVPIAHGEGSFYADQDTIKSIEDNNQVLVRYVDQNGEVKKEANPNGSINNIAGICNKERNVFGLMPHPERASEDELGSSDGKSMFESMVKVLMS